MQDPVLLGKIDRVAILTLNRPDKLNALNYACNDLLLSYLEQIEGDDSIGAIILTGAGRAFSAGGDIPEFALSIRQGPATASQEFVMRGQKMTARIENFPKPIIAAVNGIAYGGGCEITEAAHLAIASERAIFAKPEVAIGIPPTFGGTQRLPRLIGRKRALQLLLTGDPFDARNAQSIGLINKVVPHDQLMPEALALAERMLKHSSPVLRAILAAVAQGQGLAIAEGLAIEAAQFAMVASSHDTSEGLSAWQQRRRPIYRGL